MKTSIALASAALLLGAALSRPATNSPAPPRKPATAALPAPEPLQVSAAPSTLDVLGILGRAWLPTPQAVVAQRLDDDVLAYKRAVLREVAILLENAYLGIYQEHYDRTIRNCELILRIDRHYSVARELLALAQRLRHMNLADVASIDRVIEPWILATSPDFDEPVIPRVVTFRFPTLDEWAELAARESDSMIGEFHRTYSRFDLEADLAEFEAMHAAPGVSIASAPPVRPEGFDAVLEATRVDLDVQNWPLTAIVDELRTRTGLDLRVTGHHEEYISFKGRDLSLRKFLSRLLEPRGQSYAIDGVTVWIGTKPKGN